MFFSIVIVSNLFVRVNYQQVIQTHNLKDQIHRNIILWLLFHLFQKLLHSSNSLIPNQVYKMLSSLELVDLLNFNYLLNFQAVYPLSCLIFLTKEISYEKMLYNLEVMMKFIFCNCLLTLLENFNYKFIFQMLMALC